MKASDKVLEIAGKSCLTEDIDEQNNLYLKAIMFMLFYTNKDKLDQIELKG